MIHLLIAPAKSPGFHTVGKHDVACGHRIAIFGAERQAKGVAEPGQPRIASLRHLLGTGRVVGLIIVRDHPGAVNVKEQTVQPGQSHQFGHPLLRVRQYAAWIQVVALFAEAGFLTAVGTHDGALFSQGRRQLGG